MSAYLLLALFAALFVVTHREVRAKGRFVEVSVAEPLGLDSCGDSCRAHSKSATESLSESASSSPAADPETPAGVPVEAAREASSSAGEAFSLAGSARPGPFFPNLPQKKGAHPHE